MSNFFSFTASPAPASKSGYFWGLLLLGTKRIVACIAVLANENLIYTATPPK